MLAFSYSSHDRREISMKRYGFLDASAMALCIIHRARPGRPLARPQLQLRRRLTISFSSSSSSFSTTSHKLIPHRQRRRVAATLLTLITAAGLTLLASGTLTNLFLPSASPSLNPQSFTPFTLIAKEPVGDGSSAVFTFEGPGADIWTRRESEGEGEGEAGARIYSVQVAVEEMQVWRKYTPLPPLPPPASSPSAAQTSNPPTTTIRLLIRNATPSGLVSRHIHALPLGSRLPIRGPFVEYHVPRQVDEVICLVGGTGVAVALQLVAGLLARGDPDRKLTVRVLWGVRAGDSDGDGDGDGGERGRTPWRRTLPQPPTNSPIHRSLLTLHSHHPTLLTISQHIDHTPSALRPHSVLPLLNNNNNNNNNNPTKLLLLSGPPGFLAYWVGPKTWRPGLRDEAQGPLGGVLGAEAAGRGWVVWKM
jgi:hypothetical protein